MPETLTHRRRRPSVTTADWLERTVDEVALARYEIRHGRFQRSMAAVTGLSAVVSGFEAFMQHRRGAFSHWLMWTPVWLTPPTALAAGAALVSEGAARRLLPAISLVSLADGIVGFVYHIRGIQRLPGGLRLGRYNLVIGPPLFAPLLTCTVGVTGLLTGLLRRERAPERGRGRSGVRLVRATRPGSVPGFIDRLEAEVASGEFQRGLAITAGVFAGLAGAEAYFGHLRGSFNQRVMWTPVLVAPPMLAAAIGAAASERIAHDVLPLASVIAFLDGLLGFALHLRGIERMPGGVDNLQFKITMGPPVFAPLLFCSVGLLGLLASLLRRRTS